MSTPIVSTPSIITASPAGGLSSEQQLKAFEENKAALKDLQEEMSIYRRERAENERYLLILIVSLNVEIHCFS